MHPSSNEPQQPRQPHDEYHDLNGVPPKDRAAEWERILSTSLLPMSIRLPEKNPEAFKGSVTRQWLGDLALVECTTDAFSGYRGISRINAADDEFVMILMDVTGYEWVRQRDTTVQVRPGGGVALSSALDLSFDVPMPYRKRCLVIPASTLAESGALAPLRGCIELPPESPAVTLLSAYLATLSQVLRAMPAVQRTAARNAALELVQGALRPGTAVDGAGVTPALRASMHDWINRHLLEPGLTPAALAAAYCVSERTVYRIFSAGGSTFGAVVRARRLARARNELLLGNQTVSDLATRWGFADSSHFSRSFKKTFGYAPTDYRARSRASGEPEEPLAHKGHTASSRLLEGNPDIADRQE
ncbi:helix-turn-helix domain-containing protein [Streptomyces sp. NPDC004059]